MTYQKRSSRTLVKSQRYGKDSDEYERTGAVSAGGLA